MQNEVRISAHEPIRDLVGGWLLFVAAFAASLTTGIASAGSLPQLVTPNLRGAVVGVSYAERLVLGSPDPIVSMSVDGLPPGLVAIFDGSAALTISGVPSAGGNFALVIHVANGSGNRDIPLDLAVYEYSQKVDSIGIGLRHACAAVDGGVQCWGNNGYGALGNGTTVSSSKPVFAIPRGSGVTAVSTGYDTTCAIVAGGIQCWGIAELGTIGDGSDEYERRTLPVPVFPAGRGATAVALGYYQACAIVQGGVLCWGLVLDGKQNLAGRQHRSTPAYVLPTSFGAVSIGVGVDHACALSSDGRVACWGANDFGQLGDDAVNGSATPVIAIPAGSGVTAISVGISYSCATKAGGLLCWGRMLAWDTSRTTIDGTPTPTSVLAEGSGVTALSAGPGNPCVIIGGGLRCFGYYNVPNSGAQRSQGSPPGFDVYPPSSNVTLAVTDNGFALCAIVDRILRCDGMSDPLAIGYGDPVPSSAYVTVPANAKLWGDTYQNCVGAGAAARCWGSVLYTQTNTLTPISVFTGGNEVTDVSRQCAAIDGGVRCMAFDNLGKPAGPVQPIAAGSGVTRVATGEYHSCAVQNGGVRCWGGNYEGELGDGTNTASTQPVVALVAGSGATAVAVGDVHSCAVVNGGLACWGANYYGQLADGTTTRRFNPTMVIPTGSGVTDVKAGTQSTCVIANGGLRCWGIKDLPRITVGFEVATSRGPAVPIPAGSGVTGVAVGARHACAIVAGGVQCWGENNRSTLGDGTSVDSDAPVTAIPAGSGVTIIVAGDSHSCALVRSEVVCWGLNFFGQTGNPDSSSQTAKPHMQIVSPLAQTQASLGVSLVGSGAGTVTSADLGIACGSGCSKTFAAQGVGALRAQADPGSEFMGWLGACTGRTDCSLTVNGPTTVTASFARSAQGTWKLDVDRDGRIDALTDGIVVLRYLFGVRGPSLLAGATGPASNERDPDVIAARLDDMKPLLDVDGDGQVDGLSDGLIVLRSMFGIQGWGVYGQAFSGNRNADAVNALLKQLVN